MNINKRLQALSLRSCTSTEFAFMKAVEEMGEAVNQPERCDELDISEAADASFTNALENMAIVKKN